MKTYNGKNLVIEAPRSDSETIGESELLGSQIGEISLRTLSQEVLEASPTLGVETVERATPKVSPWRPDEVRKQRKLKAQMEYRKKRKLKAKPKMKYQKRKKLERDRNWKNWNVGYARCPWRKYSRIWKINKREVEITKEEFLQLMEEVGYLDVARIVCYQKVAKRDNFLIVDGEGRILFRGTNVPESFPAFGHNLPRLRGKF